jgi:hypothetical protein
MSKILYLSLDKPVGTLFLDRGLSYKGLTLKSFSIKFTTSNSYASNTDNTRFFIKLTGLSGCVISNNGIVSGVPLLYKKSMSSLWMTDLTMDVTSKLTEKLDFEIVDQFSQPIDFTNIGSFELVFQLD